MLQHTREGKDTRWSNWRERKFFIICAHVFAELWSLSTTIYVSTTYQYLVQRKLALSWQAMMRILPPRYLHESYQYLVKKKRHLSGRSMTDNWSKVNLLKLLLLYFPRFTFTYFVTNFSLYFHVYTFRLCSDRRKSWTDGSTEQTNAIQRWLKDSKMTI